MVVDSLVLFVLHRGTGMSRTNSGVRERTLLFPLWRQARSRGERTKTERADANGSRMTFKTLRLELAKKGDPPFSVKSKSWKKTGWFYQTKMENRISTRTHKHHQHHHLSSRGNSHFHSRHLDRGRGIQHQLSTFSLREKATSNLGTHGRNRLSIRSTMACCSQPTSKHAFRLSWISTIVTAGYAAIGVFYYYVRDLKNEWNGLSNSVSVVQAIDHSHRIFVSMFFPPFSFECVKH